MKSIHLAPLALSLGLASATAAFAQAAQDAPADFGPPAPSDVLQQPPEPGAPLAAPADFAQPQPAPALRDETPPALRDETPPAQEIAPPLPPDESPRVGDTRRAAPATPPAARTRGPSAQTGPYLGRGLFNNFGPNDFGA